MKPEAEGLREERNLQCMLTDADVRERSDALAQCVKEKADLQIARKAVVAGFKKRIDKVIREAESLAEEIRDRSTHRPVECVWLRDELSLRMELQRTDTHETVESRPMTLKERQGKLFDEPEAVSEITEN